MGLADAGGEVDLGAVGEAVVGDAGVQLLEGDAQLHAGEVGAEAEVVAAAEGEVLVRLAVEVDDVGGELGLVVVGGAEHEGDAVALLDLDVVERDVLRRRRAGPPSPG